MLSKNNELLNVLASYGFGSKAKCKATVDENAIASS